MTTCRTPQTNDEFKQYYHLRWKILRLPWQQKIGSEKDELEDQSIHRFIVDTSEVPFEDQQVHDTVIAVGRMHLTTQHCAQIRYMAVEDNMQGRGLGKKIIESLEHAAIELGVKEISLNARSQAITFYQQLGYVLLDYSHTLYNDVEHFKMTKRLDNAEDSNTLLAHQLQQVWHQTIPLSKAMNIEVSYFNGNEIITTCDEKFNKNIHNTMFAGSIYTLATLTGWGWVYCLLTLNNAEADIVLADANIRYHAPIKGIAHAKTSTELSSGNIQTISKKKKVRIKVTVHVYCGDKLVATFNGQYVALTKKVS